MMAKGWQGFEEQCGAKAEGVTLRKMIFFYSIVSRYQEIAFSVFGQPQTHGRFQEDSNSFEETKMSS